MTNENVIINKMGSPCSKNCCDNPDTFTPEHKCEKEYCEEYYRTECKNCGRSCYCEF